MATTDRRMMRVTFHRGVAFRADPSLHEVMQALIRTRRESELGTLLKRRRSLQDLIDKNIIVAGPPGSPNMRNARQKLLKHLQRSQLSNFLVNRPSLVEVAKLNVLEGRPPSPLTGRQQCTS